MNRKNLTKYALICSSIVATVALSSSMPSYAVGGTITKTGPGSNNTINETSNTNCDVSNNNNLSLNSNTNQSASSGDIDLSNITSVGSDWDSWNPALWKKNGYTYQQWRSAITAHLSTVQSSYDSLSAVSSGGNISTGDSTNSNDTIMNISLKNDSTAPCIKTASKPTTGTIDTTGPGSSNTIAKNTVTLVESANTNRLAAALGTNQAASSGDLNANEATKVGGAATGDTKNKNNTSGNVSAANDPRTTVDPPITPTQDMNASIKQTGPNSTNTISNTTTSSVNTSNSNSLVIDPNVGQSSTSGAIDVGAITQIGGGAASGDANNQNSFNANLLLSNK
jgi:hypothetical protein